jgi:hypothetical protein
MLSTSSRVAGDGVCRVSRETTTLTGGHHAPPSYGRLAEPHPPPVSEERNRERGESTYVCAMHIIIVMMEWCHYATVQGGSCACLVLVELLRSGRASLRTITRQDYESRTRIYQSRMKCHF